MSREKLIRYRIYVQSSPKAKKDYVINLSKGLWNLHNNISLDQDFLHNYSEEPIISKTFIPLDLNHINPKFFIIISNISSYFNCLTIWETKMIKGTDRTIKTFTIFGYHQEALLSYHYITKIINNLNYCRLNYQTELRRLKINKRRQKKKTELNSYKEASILFYSSIDYINEITNTILEDREKTLKYKQKTQNIWKHLISSRKINFKSYRIKRDPIINDAICRVNKFCEKRIILVNN